MENDEVEAALQTLEADNQALQLILVSMMSELIKEGHRTLVEGAFDRADKTLRAAERSYQIIGRGWDGSRVFETLAQLRRNSGAD